MKTLLIIFMLFAVPAYAQHPCDGPYTTTGPTLVAGAHTLSVCWAGQGAGTWTLTDNGVKSSLGVPSVSSNANKDGLKFYSWPVTLQTTPTAHTYVAEVCVSDGIGGMACQATAPFVQPSVKAPPPPVPVGLRVE